MLKRLILLVSIVALGGCGSSSSSNSTPTTPTAPTTPTTPNAHGSMSATINGAAWSSSSSIAPTYQVDILTLAGLQQGGQALTIILSFVPTNTTPLIPGVYNITPALPNVQLGVTFLNSGSLFRANATLGEGSGSITLSTLTSTGATGTFAFTLVPSGGGPGSLQVTNGVFNVTF
jgi:uncharacterized protein DUF6252